MLYRMPMFTVLLTRRFRSQNQQPPWLIVEPERRAALAIENVLSKLGWSVVGPIGNPDKALPLARQSQLAGAVLDLQAANGRVYAVAEALARRRIPFVFITAQDHGEVREDFRDRPSLPRSFLMERLRPLLQDVVPA